MSYQYYIREEKKEKLVRDSLVLCHGYHLTTKKSLLRQFQHHSETLHDDIKRNHMCC
jgi:hypothetical protein